MRGGKGLMAVGVALLGLTSAARGQVPAIPGVPAGVAGDAAAVAPVAVAPVAAAPRTLWSFLGLSKANLAACKQKICASPLGGMLNGMLGPASTMTGGLIPQFCPAVPTDAQVAALAASGGPTGAEAVAAKIKQDEADAKARRAAIRYLSTASCHYWPEAEAAIIGGLRDDRNECVRYEAALALLNGCCCTSKTIEALNIVVSGSEKDGKPSETSERVKAVSLAALQGCLLRYHPPAQPIPLERPEPASATTTVDVLPPGFNRVAYYYQNLRDVPPDLIVAEARRTIDRSTAPGAASSSSTLLTGKRSVYHALARATIAPPVPPQPGPAPDPTAAPPPPLIPNSMPISTPASAPAAPAARRVLPSAEAGDGVRQTSTERPAPDRLARPSSVPVRRAAAKPLASRTQPSPTERRNLRDIFMDSLSGSGGR